jgi:hypothetical protein
MGTLRRVFDEVYSTALRRGGAASRGERAATAAIATVVGLKATTVEGQNRVSFAEGFAVSELRDESVGGQRGVRFAASLLLAAETIGKGGKFVEAALKAPYVHVGKTLPAAREF